MAISVLVVDDHEVIRSGLAVLLEGSAIEIVAEAGECDQAIELACQHRPDVVLLDVRMNEDDGLRVLREVRSQLPDSRVVIHSTYDNPTYMARALTYGADDYVLKGSDRDELVAAIEAAARGEKRPEGSRLQELAGKMEDSQRDEKARPLTGRESQVLRHMALGLSNKEIGRSLDISVETVKEHVQNILRKIDVRDRTHAAVWAVKHGMV